MKPVVHYPRDGITYSKGACGSHSVSSILDWEMVTCPKCKELKQKLDKGLHSPYNSTHTKQLLGAIIMKSKAFTYICVAIVVMCVVGLIAQIQF